MAKCVVSYEVHKDRTWKYLKMRADQSVFLSYTFPGILKIVSLVSSVVGKKITKMNIFS